MIVFSYAHLADEYVAQAAGWLAGGTLHTEQTVVEGIDRAPEAFLATMKGANLGKMLLKIG